MGVDFCVYVPDDKKNSHMSYSTFDNMRVAIATKYLHSKGVDIPFESAFGNLLETYPMVHFKLKVLAREEDEIAIGLVTLLDKCDCEDEYSTYECELILNALEKIKDLFVKEKDPHWPWACKVFMETLRYAVENDGYVIAC